jgi:hypothetical protein
MKATGFGGCEHVGVPEGCIQYWEYLGNHRKYCAVGARMQNTFV